MIISSGESTLGQRQSRDNDWTAGREKTILESGNEVKEKNQERHEEVENRLKYQFEDGIWDHLGVVVLFVDPLVHPAPPVG